MLQLASGFVQLRDPFAFRRALAKARDHDAAQQQKQLGHHISACSLKEGPREAHVGEVLAAQLFTQTRELDEDLSSDRGNQGSRRPDDLSRETASVLSFLSPASALLDALQQDDPLAGMSQDDKDALSLFCGRLVQRMEQLGMPVGGRPSASSENSDATDDVHAALRHTEGMAINARPLHVYHLLDDPVEQEVEHEEQANTPVTPHEVEGRPVGVDIYMKGVWAAGVVWLAARPVLNTNDDQMGRGWSV